ncbi:formyl-coenzyme A transferase [Variibacter gotjawalensis]|uniref:Formyl-coenzyme A transferase n=1 Tax=Variibacter gotjawalensis TaxID=1333996 RepID=A0A0S3PS72_9BRAD|nr:CoA transferase [Variibacter gotjawalensis]NIK49118.1 formyl-CoA transferase [Variibacter gotjawalensis]RZS50974.1 formyl-CoA transferase [Variibacter gotjawalensis]BAT58808.1 formyl-coenzyme A transferase [Variibacter gotjawalensis]
MTGTSNAAKATGPLAGVKILDLTHVLLGPLGTMICGDFGADIIKVESAEGDTLRATGIMRNPGMGAAFLQANRNKRSIVIDLKKPEGAAILRELIKDADIFVHSMRAAAVRRLGFSYDDVKAINPRLIYCAAIGFGTKGPHADRPAYDDIIQGEAGVIGAELALTGAPRFASSLIADKTVGLTVAYALMAALYAREKSGKGQAIEIPMFETMVQFSMMEHLAGMVFEPSQGPVGHMRIRGRRAFATRDGHVCILAYTDRHWRALFPVFGHPEFVADPRYVNAVERQKRMGELYDMIEKNVAQMSTEDCLAVMTKADIPCGKVNRIEDLIEEPHAKAVGLFQDIDHPSEGRIRNVRPAVEFSDTPAQLRTPAPRLGEHTRDVLREAGYADADVESLIAAGVVKAG